MKLSICLVLLLLTLVFSEEEYLENEDYLEESSPEVNERKDCTGWRNSCMNNKDSCCWPWSCVCWTQGRYNKHKVRIGSEHKCQCRLW